MKRLFNRRSNMWKASIRFLAKELKETLEATTYEDLKIDALVNVLEGYVIYRPVDRSKSNVLWRLSAPFYYLTGIVCFVLLSPILYIFNIELMESDFYHKMREWEKKL